jgi:hypothetical protein
MFVIVFLNTIISLHNFVPICFHSFLTSINFLIINKLIKRERNIITKFFCQIHFSFELKAAKKQKKDKNNH